MSGHLVGMDSCFIHGEVFAFDPDTVLTVWIDRETGRPPDVGADGQPQPLPADWQARCSQRPICPRCAAMLAEARGQ